MHHNNIPTSYNQQGQQQRPKADEQPYPTFTYPPFSNVNLSAPAPYPSPLPSLSNALCNISPDVLRKVREEYGKQLAERNALEAEETRRTEWQRLEKEREIEAATRRQLEQEALERAQRREWEEEQAKRQRINEQYAFMANSTEPHSLRPNDPRLRAQKEKIAPFIQNWSTAKATMSGEASLLHRVQAPPPTPLIPRVQLSLQKAAGLPSSLTDHLSNVLQDGRVFDEIRRLRNDQAIKERELLERRKLLALQHGKRRNFAKNRPGYEDMAAELEEELFEEMHDLDVRCIRELDGLIEVQQKIFQKLGVPTFKTTMDTSELALQARVLTLIIDNMPKSS